MSPFQAEDEALRIVPVADDRAESLGNLAAIVIEQDHAYVAPGALHGRSPVERDVRWADDPAEVPNGTTYWIAWVTLKRTQAGKRGYHGLTVSPMRIDREARVGYKRLAQHVNAMKAALEGNVDLEELPVRSRRALAAELKRCGLEYWRNASQRVRDALRVG